MTAQAGLAESTFAMRLGLAVLVLSCAAGLSALAADEDPEGLAILKDYAAAAERRDVLAAVGYLLDYSVLTRGENAPQTAELTHRYGVLLMREGNYREASRVLKEALARSNAAFGELGGEAFDINMNLGHAYSHLGRRRIYRIQYFDRALEILAQRGERETPAYVTALLNIVRSLADNDGLTGNTTSTVVNNLSDVEGNEALLRISYDYRGNFFKAEKYLDEAEELAAKLVHEDRFLPAKVAIARTKLNVLKTADLANVAMGVGGRITPQTVAKRNDRDEAELSAAMTELAEDEAANAEYLAAAYMTLFDIAWLDNDRSRLEALCAAGTVDDAARYPPDRLFRIDSEGTVIAPTFSFFVPPNLFESRVRRHKPARDSNGDRIPQPYFVPACINGELMAALVNAPRVLIEEYE